MNKAKDDMPVLNPPADMKLRKGGALTKNPIQKAVNRCMGALADLDRQEHREAAHRILGELLASERAAPATEAVS